MTFNEFQEKSKRTISKKLPFEEKIAHAVFGISSEAGEIAGLYQKYLQGHPLNTMDVVEEIGDLLWFAAELATAHGITLDFIAENNVEKLNKRYKDVFTTEASIARVDHAE